MLLFDFYWSFRGVKDTLILRCYSSKYANWILIRRACDGFIERWFGRFVLFIYCCENIFHKFLLPLHELITVNFENLLIISIIVPNLGQRQVNFIKRQILLLSHEHWALLTLERDVKIEVLFDMSTVRFHFFSIDWDFTFKTSDINLKFILIVLISYFRLFQLLYVKLLSDHYIFKVFIITFFGFSSRCWWKFCTWNWSCVHKDSGVPL